MGYKSSRFPRSLALRAPYVARSPTPCPGTPGEHGGAAEGAFGSVDKERRPLRLLHDRVDEGIDAASLQAVTDHFKCRHQRSLQMPPLGAVIYPTFPFIFKLMAGLSDTPPTLFSVGSYRNLALLI